MLAKYIVFLAFVLIAVSLSSADGKLEYCVDFLLKRMSTHFLRIEGNFSLFYCIYEKILGSNPKRIS